MRVERYVARDSRSAMAQVRAELGADALILANRRVAGQVEITAAIDVEHAVANAVPKRRSASEPERRPTPAASPTNEIQLKALENELERLRNILDKELGGRKWQETGKGPAQKSVLRQRLLRMGLSRTLAGELLDRLPRTERLDVAWRQIVTTLGDRLQISEAETIPGELTAVYGGTGVGKTSTIARLAGEDIQRIGSNRVGLVTLDSYRVGAQEQLASFADALGVPLFVADDRQSLSLALKKMQGRKIYIDTAGMSQHDARLRRQYELVRGFGKTVRHVLVLAASAQASQCRALAANFAPRALSGAIISKVDEAQSLGGVLDVVISARLPLLGFSDGQRIPEDLHYADGLELVRRAVQLADVDPAVPARQLRVAS
ncbi:flagellar biosynthesis protein FlhF [Congregibacter brevis]|uniref:Flagellar biosynthesis protein FlhF n=1 Tax=Congregibacter brevis TaxID=3081201 RepID=A0ABZ0IAR0_9GAMM|nr:flagellar biosynthesis protein FlhF [Congregibacter sp. IMCC45268]